ncbi:MAG: phosphate ABC transporter substrate-binding protein, partial [Deltaproteobacteria bacterium]|nr:phosphate ABC transporter substrate-binding protein [Deltaproteobacteria bacterium]
AGQPNAIAILSVGEAERRDREGAVFKLLPLDGVAATSRMVRTGEFPISRSLNLVTKGFPDGVKLAFMQFALSSQIIDLVRDYDFVPYLD